LTAAEGPTSFTGGADTAPDNTKNTATLVRGVVHALAGVTAVASGTGATPLTAAEGPTAFTGGGDNYAIVTTGDDVKAAIAANDAANILVAVADAALNDGSGVVTAMGATALAGGADADDIETVGGALPLAVPIPSEGAVGQIAYTGGKRFLRAKLTATGSPSGALGVIVVKGRPQYRPAS
jgi:hypothetical protein